MYIESLTVYICQNIARYRHITKICAYFVPALAITFTETILFGNKLKQLLLINDKSRTNIMILTNIGTRIVGLIFVSLILTILHFISTILLLYKNKPSKFAIWFDGYATIIDIFGNYLCVLLAFKSHKKLYYNLCILVDISCKYWWDIFIGIFYNETQENIKMLESTAKNTDGVTAKSKESTSTNPDITIKTASKDNTVTDVHP